MFDDVDGLTAEHRARIVAALPPGVEMTPEAWADLHEIVVGYRIFETRRASYPIAEERKHRERLEKAVDTAAAELRRETLWPDPDPTWRKQALASLSEVRRKVEALAAFHEIWSAFARRQNPHRKFLYWGVMRVWTDRLGGELRYSTKESTRYGPLIRFFDAVVGPILGSAALRASGIAASIDREITDRKRTEAEKKRRLSQS